MLLQVISVADDVFDIKSGDIVFCDPLVGFPSNDTGRYDFILQGWTLLSPEGVHSKAFLDAEIREISS